MFFFTIFFLFFTLNVFGLLRSRLQFFKSVHHSDVLRHFNRLSLIERYPSKPYIKEGYPGNITVLVNDTVTLSCPPVSDLEPYLYWVRPYNYSAKNPEVGPSDMPIPPGNVTEVH